MLQIHFLYDSLADEVGVSRRNRTNVGHGLTKRRKPTVATTSPTTPPSSPLTARIPGTYDKSAAAEEGWCSDEIDGIAKSFRGTALTQTTESNSKPAPSHDVGYRITQDVSFPNESMMLEQDLRNKISPRSSRRMSTVVRKHRQDMVSWTVIALAVVAIVLAAIPEKYAARPTHVPAPAPGTKQTTSLVPSQDSDAKTENKISGPAASLSAASNLEHDDSSGPLAIVLQRYPWSAANRKAARLAIENASTQEVRHAEELEELRARKTQDQCHAAWEWMSTLGSPATLVGGAALASFFELRDQLAPSAHDSRSIRVGKNVVLLLLMSSFACEICCVCK